MVTARSPRVPVRPNLVLLGLIGCALALVIGLSISSVWSQIEWARAWELGAWLALTAALSLIASRLSGRPPQLIVLLMMPVLALLLHGIGACAVVLLIALAAGSLGDRIGVNARRHPALAAIVGLALITGVAGWLQAFAIFQRPLLSAVLVLVLLLLRTHLRAFVAGVAQSAARLAARRELGYGPALLLLSTLIASAQPTLQFDDLAYHAALPAQLLALGHNRLDAHGQIWTLAPWSNDLLHGLAAVLAGAEIRGAVNSLWWLLLMATLIEALRSAVASPRVGRWALALVASLPLSWMLLAGMQTELATAVALLALLTLLLQPPAPGQGRVLGLLVGLLLGLKLSNLAYVGALAVAALCCAPRRTLAALPQALPLTLLAGGSSYAYAAWISGNPVLPLFNSWFGSSHVGPNDLLDMRYRAGLDGGDYYGALFDSSTYLEGWDGSAGFQWLLLALPLLIGLWRRPAAAPAQPWLPLHWAMLAVFLGALALFAQMQYLRYLYPAMVIGGIAIGLGVAHCGGDQSLRAPLGLALRLALGLCVALNLLTVGNVHWQLREGLLSASLRGPAAAQRWEAQVAPERQLIALARQLQPDSNVLLADPGYPYIASGLGRAFTTAWYDPQLQAVAAQCHADPSGQCWRGQLQTLGFELLINRPDGGSGPALEAALEDWAEPLSRVGAAVLYRLPVNGGRDLYQERSR